MNTDLLFLLYAIHSPSGSEKKMRNFVKNYAKRCGAVVEQDAHGNLFVTKGASDTYPCLASHLDQVQRTHAKDFTCLCSQGVVFGYSPNKHEQQGLGADDKNGIWVCLECLRKYDALKCAFFVGEETGCVGSSQCDLGFFEDCRFIVQPDRRGNCDLITDMFCGDVCSDEFVKAIRAEEFGYKRETGSITDVGELVQRGVGISCLNVSCGYYEAHTDQEFTVLSELENCLHFVESIIEGCTDVYPFTYEGRSYGGYGGYGSWNRWDGRDYDRWRKDGEDDEGNEDELEADYHIESLFLDGVFCDYKSFVSAIKNHIKPEYDGVKDEHYAHLWNELYVYETDQIDWSDPKDFK